jgi:hypothetical protein
MSIDLISVLAEYNEAIWPVQIVAYVLAGFLLYFAVRPTGYSTRIIAAILGLFWLWTGFAFFLPYAVEYTPTYYFSALFAFQGLLFLFHAVRPKVDLSCACRRDVYNISGLVLILYALIGYPLVATLAGRGYPEMATFAVTPCPLTVFTFGIFLLTDRHVPYHLLAIPLLWAIAGVLWVNNGMVEDVGLVLSGVMGTSLLLFRDATRPEETGNGQPVEAAG